jgi:hypothetical protein
VAFTVRSQIAEELTRKPDPVRSASYSSNSWQSPWRNTSTWRSPVAGSGALELPPSIGASRGIGIGPGSLSSE